MKWTIKKQSELRYLYLQDYSEEVTKFIWWPIMIDGCRIWMEKATLKRIPWRTESVRGIKYYWAYVDIINT